MSKQHFSCTKVFYGVPCKTQIVKAFLLNILTHIECAHELQGTVKMVLRDLKVTHIA